MLADHLETCQHRTSDNAREMQLEKDEYTTELFDMRFFDLNECASPACIAGHTIALFSLKSSKTRMGTTSSREAQGFLNLTNKQAEDLFYPSQSEICSGKYILDRAKKDGFLRDPCEFITPKVAAATLRNLAKTGEVVWRV